MSVNRLLTCLHCLSLLNTVEKCALRVVVGNIFSLLNYPLNHLSLYYNVVEYMADFKSTFEGDNWVKKLHFKLGDTRVP